MRKALCLIAVALAAVFLAHGSVRANDRGHDGDDHARTRTPIQHVVVIIGENRSFDHIFGTYIPPKGQTVCNLRSEGIIKADGSPGPNVSLAQQFTAMDSGTYSINPTIQSPYVTLPPPNTDGVPTNPFFSSVSQAQAAEIGLPNNLLNLLTIGGTGLPGHVIDTRFPSNLMNGPFQITQSVSYDDYTGSPVHRFYQMWQQLDCNASYATAKNPSGCRADLFPWVETSFGAGSNGKPQPSGFNDETTGEGALSMGFYNVYAGDVPYLTKLARQYIMSDNYHQAIMGGTGANHVAFGTAAEVYYSDGNGHPTVPPANEIENPNPMPGTNNWYTQDGYSGGSYTNCSDLTQPGVQPIMNYLHSLTYVPFNDGDCAPNSYYLLNNYNPGYHRDGTLNTSTFTVPPSSVPTIADELAAHNISWRYFGEGSSPNTPRTNLYCNICNPFQYATSIMTNPTQRANIQGLQSLYQDLNKGWLPAVAYVKPDGYLDGHPASSKFELFEGFVQKILAKLQSDPKLWQHTAVFITIDEGGGYYDSGYVQPIDYFGDGTRIPLVVVSPYSEGGRVVHSYADHDSIVKFIERNWDLAPLSDYSRDNLPNPVASPSNPYVPTNGPASSDLMDMFNFKADHQPQDKRDH